MMSHIISQPISNLSVNPLNDTGLNKKTKNNKRLTNPKKRDNIALSAHLSFFLNTEPHAIIVIPRFKNASSAAIPCSTRPLKAGGWPGISVLKIENRKAPIHQIQKVAMLVLDAFNCCNNPVSKHTWATATKKNQQSLCHRNSPQHIHLHNLP
ncbi:hypothetical protein BH11BAC4_BH11BAC4_23230 [soil metagenome]